MTDIWKMWSNRKWFRNGRVLRLYSYIIQI